MTTLPLPQIEVAIPGHPFDDVGPWTPLWFMKFAATTVNEWQARFGKAQAEQMLREMDWPEATAACFDTAWGG